MFEKNELEKLTAKELLAKCKEFGLQCYRGKSRLTKSELIDSLLNVNNTETKEEDLVPMPGSEKLSELKKEFDSAAEEKVEPEPEKEWINEDKEKYIEEANEGTLIAFLDLKGKPRTAALVNRSSKRKVVKLITEFGWEFIVPYANVLWVRNGTRWPKGVYNMLKGYKNGKEEKTNS